MDIKELRINNWVKSGSGEYLVKAICEDMAPVIESIDGKVFHTNGLIIQPIPLTEEWLEKFGFKDMSRLFWQIDNRGTFSIFKGSFIHYKTEVVIKYVHQLQNLYFALTGEDLEITY